MYKCIGYHKWSERNTIKSDYLRKNDFGIIWNHFAQCATREQGTALCASHQLLRRCPIPSPFLAYAYLPPRKRPQRLLRLRRRSSSLALLASRESSNDRWSSCSGVGSTQLRPQWPDFQSDITLVCGCPSAAPPPPWGEQGWSHILF